MKRTKVKPYNNISREEYYDKVQQEYQQKRFDKEFKSKLTCATIVIGLFCGPYILFKKCFTKND